MPGNGFGLAAIAAGLRCCFFGDQLAQPAAHPRSRYVLGSVLVLLGALVWAVYASRAEAQLLNTAVVRSRSWASSM
jgi:drug/metabolite transporter (DMT)-like permease